MVDGEMIEQPDDGEMREKSNDALTFANEIAIADDEDYKVVGEFVVGLKDVRKRIKSLYYDGVDGTKGRGPVPLSRAAWQANIDAYNSVDNVAKKAVGIAGGKMETYIVERDRKSVEAKLKADKERADKAAALEAGGKTAEARAVSMAPPPPMPDRPVVAGLRVAKGWDFEINDESKLPREYLKPDEKAIRDVVKALGDKTNIAGVRVFPSAGIAGAGGKRK